MAKFTQAEIDECIIKEAKYYEEINGFYWQILVEDVNNNTYDLDVVLPESATDVDINQAISNILLNIERESITPAVEKQELINKKVSGGISLRKFMLTGEVKFPKEVVFRKPNKLGLHEKSIIDSKGDVVTIEMYLDYDGVTYSNLAVKEDRVYTRDSSGVVSKRDTTITYYYEDETICDEVIFRTKYYSSKAGYNQNKKSRTTLIDSASMWIYGELIVEFGYDEGEANAKYFLDDLNGFIGKYIRGNIQSLIDAISSNSRTYITQDRKDQLNTILNVQY